MLRRRRTKEDPSSYYLTSRILKKVFLKLKEGGIGFEKKKKKNKLARKGLCPKGKTNS
jgi:hypothetical protein